MRGTASAELGPRGPTWVKSRWKDQRRTRETPRESRRQNVDWQEIGRDRRDVAVATRQLSGPNLRRVTMAIAEKRKGLEARISKSSKKNGA